MWLVPGVVGGSEESVTDALRAVAEEAPADLQLHLAVLRPFLDAHPDLAEAFPTAVSTLDGADKARRVLAEQTWLARTARSLGADVVHHAGGTVPLVHPGRVVLTIQDLQPLDMPENFSLAKRTYLRTMLGRSARAARGGVRAERVQPPAGGRAARCRAGSGAGGPLVAASGPGRDRPRRAGSGRAVAGSRRPVPAVPGDHLPPQEPPGAVGGVRPSGPGSRRRSPGPHRRCRARPRTPYVHASRTWGWPTGWCAPAGSPHRSSNRSTPRPPPSWCRHATRGSGCRCSRRCCAAVRCVAARAGSLPEFARPEDLVDPDDVTGWTAAMQSVLTLSDRARSERIAEGRRAVARFTPGRTAAGLLDAYRAARRSP